MAYKKYSAKKPPLSFLDKLIYSLIFLFDMAFILPYYYVFVANIVKAVVLSKSNVVAYDNDLIFLTSMFLCVCICFPIVVLCSYCIANRQPIFVNRKYSPKPFNYSIKVYPVFSKDFKKNVIDKNKTVIKKYAKIYLILLLISIMIFPLGLYSRIELDSDNRLATYNTFNKETHSCDIQDTQKVIIAVYKIGRAGTLMICMDFVFEEKTYRFTINDFSEMSIKEALDYMIELKKTFSKNQYEIKHKDRLDYLIEYDDYTNEETALAYELFR